MKDWHKVGITLIAGGAVTASLLFGGSTASIDSTTAVQNDEETYFQSHGKYKQVIMGNKVPAGKEDVVTAFGKPIPDTSEVNVYEGPKGSGYQIGTKTQTGTDYIGYGSEAANFTYFIPAPPPAPDATTTP